MLMKAELPAEAGNAPVAARLETVRTVLETLKPEAITSTRHEIRTTLVIFDMKSPSDMPSIAEPLSSRAHESSLTSHEYGRLETGRSANSVLT